MNKRLITMFGMLSMSLTPTTYAQESNIMTNKASYIEIIAAEQQTENLATFLKGAAPLVKETEPETELWFALQSEDSFAIFDVFTNENARNAHFSGKVASALKQNSGQLVQGGWENGVVANIHNSTVLSEKAPVDIYSATTATYIKLKAAPGKADYLAGLLTAAGSIVADTEPKTLYWVALRLDANNFAIFDIFANNSGREAHFAGKVANLLKDKSSILVEGGWNEGVVNNVNNYKILAMK